MSDRKSKNNKYVSTWTKHKDWDPSMTNTGKLYVSHPYDIRLPCTKQRCKPISKYISINKGVGGTFAYSISRKGAQKMLDFIGPKVSNHIDQYLKNSVQTKVCKSLNFNPPIVWHEFGMEVAGKSSIEWI